MASRYRWRQQLLGSLQGQLQLATYLVVFLGFTGASSVGLLIGQRNLLANDQQLARQSIALCDKAIRGLQDDPGARTGVAVAVPLQRQHQPLDRIRQRNAAAAPHPPHYEESK